MSHPECYPDLSWRWQSERLLRSAADPAALRSVRPRVPLSNRFP